MKQSYRNLVTNCLPCERLSKKKTIRSFTNVTKSPVSNHVKRLPLETTKLNKFIRECCVLILIFIFFSYYLLEK